MKILIASYYPLPVLGGIWMFFLQLQKRLERLGRSVDILSHNIDVPNYWPKTGTFHFTNHSLY